MEKKEKKKNSYFLSAFVILIIFSSLDGKWLSTLDLGAMKFTELNESCKTHSKCL